MGLREYLTTLSAAALIIAVIQTILPKNSAITSVGKLLTGLFMVITLIVPLRSVDISRFDDRLPDIQAYAEDYAAAGTQYRADISGQVIKEQTESYIYDKATQLGASVQIEVTLTDDVIPSPWTVPIQGSISPYGKQTLQAYITDTIGIPKERQIWS